MFITETYGTSKLIYFVEGKDDKKLIARLVNDVFSIRAYGYKNNVLLLTHFSGNKLSYEFESLRMKTNIDKPEFSDTDSILKLSKMLADKRKLIHKTVFDTKPPYKWYTYFDDNHFNIQKNDGLVRVNNKFGCSKESDDYFSGRESDSTIHVLGMEVRIDKSIVKYNSWLAVSFAKLFDADIYYSYITSEDYNIIANKVIGLLE